MKKIIVAAYLFSFYTLAAPISNPVNAQQSLQMDTLPPKPVSVEFSKSKPQAKLSHVLPNGNKVYILPQDNMPCIVPNMSYYNYTMPIYKGKTLGRIPNVSPHEQIIPDTLPNQNIIPKLNRLK